MTPTLSRRFRLGAYTLCWLVASGLQRYVSDAGTHGAAVGAYVPDVLLAVAAIPYWTFFAPALLDLAGLLGAGRLSRGAMRAFDVFNAVLLIVYAAASVAVLFYVAFTNYGT